MPECSAPPKTTPPSKTGDFWGNHTLHFWEWMGKAGQSKGSLWLLEAAILTLPFRKGLQSSAYFCKPLPTLPLLPFPLPWQSTGTFLMFSPLPWKASHFTCLLDHQTLGKRLLCTHPAGVTSLLTWVTLRKRLLLSTDRLIQINNLNLKVA